MSMQAVRIQSVTSTRCSTERFVAVYVRICACVCICSQLRAKYGDDWERISRMRVITYYASVCVCVCVCPCSSVPSTVTTGSALAV